MWVQEGVERYIVCSPGAAGTVREYDANADVVELPPPVRAAFFDAPEQSVAQQRLDLDAEKPTVLLTGGGWGRGPITEYSVALADGGYQVLVVAGSNARLAAETRAAAERRPPGSPGAIVSYGYVEQMNTLMAAAHVVVTTPGQTCHEARVVGRPMVLLDAVPGHGRENLLIELASGGAVASLPDPIRVVNAVDAVLDHDVATPTGWPIRDAADWRKRFVAAVADLLPPERPHDRTEFGWTAGPAAYHA
jgi:UDP-N-acetylglucosamine:LPS N-acetylglucosamine transferase